MNRQIRRVVTTMSPQGNSSILSDERLTPNFSPKEFPGLEVTEIWRTSTLPIDIYELYQPLEIFERDLLPGHTRFGILNMPPLKDLLAYQESIGNPIHDLKKFRLHKTNTIDYVTILSGQVTLVLDSEEETLLNSGDLLVQRGTMHTWHNYGQKPCIMSIVQIGVKK